MNKHPAEKIADALGQLETITDRLEGEFQRWVDASIDWTLQTAAIFEEAEKRRATNTMAERLAAKQHPELFTRWKRAEGDMKASLAVSANLRDLIKGYQTENANVRELTR